jgi:SAM-dependent methyltransferase
MMARREGLYAERFNIGGVGEERIVACTELFKELHGDRLLDIGCGDGAVRKGINASCLDIDSEDLPFEDSSFDVVYCGEIIEHVFDPDHLLIQVRRVLRRGGLCVLTTPNLAGWPNRLALFLGFQPYPMAVSPNHEGAGKLFLSGEEGQWGHLRVFTLRALKELIRGHGFAILRVKGCPVTIKSTHVLIRPIRLLDRWLARFPSLANRVILVLRKT